ncbi:LysR family transcriptional regulator [Phragmitibacter flavus]|uniref:LysR family transcriptional regulator n=1 Tax=Phragmitibacter flavus TaxID=2576071 RepID=A0A5R8KA28_9BACT|nr:LysR family transcriptional regulator [Phragmitibacter flavus]TLD69151.1 LysR family transcriptional regulator [Phragmitibacter flavus]
MQLLTLKIFCDLVETKSFSQSALRNKITQSAVSQQIRSLEDKFGVVFFERGRRKFSITPEGQLFDRAARSILDSYEQIGPRLHQLKNVVSGPLRISTAYSIGLHGLPDILRSFRETHSNVDVQVQYRRSHTVYEDVQQGRADLGLVSFPSRSKGVIADVFDEDEMVLICSPNHPLALKKKVFISDLQDQNFVSYEADTPTGKSISRVFRQHNISLANQHEFDNLETVKRAVEVDNVISIIPLRTAEMEIAEGKLVAIHLEDYAFKRPLAVLRKQGQVTTSAMREFMNTLLNKEVLSFE